jgi:hypothetical protein
MNFVKMEAALSCARDSQMSDVNGIECAAEKRDATLRGVFTGSAV